MSDRFLRAGIPLLYFVLLYRKRGEIAQREQRQDRVEGIAHLRFLYDSYEPRCMYFEVVECARKLMLTGMLVFFFPETPSQVRVIYPHMSPTFAIDTCARAARSSSA